MSKIIIAENCKKVSECDTSSLSSAISGDVSLGLLDARVNMLSMNTTSDKTMYINYLQTLKEIAQTVRCGRYTCLLDLGFMPVLMAPSFIGGLWHNQFIEALMANNIPFKKLPASSFNSDFYTQDDPDLWVSKLDCAELLGKPPQNVRVVDLINAINIF